MGAVSTGLLKAAITALDGQPSDFDLIRAFDRAIESEGIGGAYSEYMLELRRLRELRSTWFGEQENKLRRSIDAYLSGIEPS
jgi:hypothetical protein